MKISWRTIPGTVASLLRELGLKNVYLLVSKEKKTKTYLWSHGATLRQLAPEQADWIDRMAEKGMIRSVSPLAVENSEAAAGTFYRLTPAGRYASVEGYFPVLGHAEPMCFQIRVNGKIIRPRINGKEISVFREEDGDLTRVLTYVTENSGGAFTVYAYRPKDEPLEAAPLFEVDKFEVSHYREVKVDLDEDGNNVRPHTVQAPAYRIVTTHGWPIAEVEHANS